ncbi:MAG: hypothetical protein H7141_09475 [Burkholderiales bacterium]|nr:hypothetical protein [Bacteroidia bacterium]
MKNLLLLSIIILTSCNNIIHEEDENKINDNKVLDTISSEGKLNDIINQNRDSEDSIKNVEKIEEQLKNNPQ